MKKSLKKVSIFLAIMAFAMLFKCSEAKIVGEKTDKVTAGLYTNLIEGKEVILVSPNASYKPASKNDEDKFLYKGDLNKFFSENNITVTSIKDSKGNTKGENDAITTGDIISDGTKDRILILCGDADGNTNICGPQDVRIVVYDYIKEQEATAEQKIAANLKNDDDRLTVGDINRMVKKSLGYDGSSDQNENLIGDTLVLEMPSDGSSGEDPVNPPAGEYGIEVETEGGAQITVGGTTKVKATITPASADQSVTFSSANDKIAAVDQNGTVTGVAVGETTITATSKTYKDSKTGKYLSGTVNIKITENIVHVTRWGIDFADEDATGVLKQNETLQLVIKIEPDDATYKNNVKWYSTDESIATVDKNGKVTAKSNGNVKIKAKIEEEPNLKEAEMDIVVTDKSRVEGFSWRSDITPLRIGDITEPNPATCEPANSVYETIKYSSSDESKASIDPNTGVITARDGGTVTIKVEITGKIGGMTYSAEGSKTITILEPEG